MKLLILSDIHTEFHLDKGKSFFEPYKDSDYDVAIIAGDLCDYKGLENSLKYVSNNLKQIIYISGNHEKYSSSIQASDDKIRDICSKLPNIHYLENDTVTIDGQRFAGCTLWFKDKPDNFLYSDGMSDFKVIKDFKDTVYKCNEKSINFLRQEVKSDDIVVTHYLPSEQCVAFEWRGSMLNRFFVCDVEDIILGKQPKLWCHGHTHSNIDVKINNTRLICNPFGYMRHEQNHYFKDELIIEI